LALAYSRDKDFLVYAALNSLMQKSKKSENPSNSVTRLMGASWFLTSFWAFLSVLRPFIHRRHFY